MNFKTFLESLRQDFPVPPLDNPQDVANNFLVAADKAEESGNVNEWLRYVFGWFEARLKSITQPLVREEDPALRVLRRLPYNLRTVAKNSRHVFNSQWQNDDFATTMKRLFADLDERLRDIAYDLDNRPELAQHVNNLANIARLLQEKFTQLFNTTSYAQGMDVNAELSKIARDLTHEIIPFEKAVELAAPLIQQFVQLPLAIRDRRRGNRVDRRRKNFFVNLAEDFNRLESALKNHDSEQILFYVNRMFDEFEEYTARSRPTNLRALHELLSALKNALN